MLINSKIPNLRPKIKREVYIHRKVNTIITDINYINHHVEEKTQKDSISILFKLWLLKEPD